MTPDQMPQPMQPMQELSFGQKAVWITFNPSGDDKVTLMKVLYSQIIDALNDLRKVVGQSEQGRLASVAITEAQTAQMRAVKALTWKD